MAKIAVIKTGGKQYKVAEGDVLKIERLENQAGDKVMFETLLIADGENVTIGAPFLGERVQAEVVSEAKQDKVSVIKFKSKVRYRRNVGHRQILTTVKITSIA